MRAGKLALFCEKAEGLLTCFAAPPILGAPFAITESLLGTIQLVVAIAIYIFSKILSLFLDDGSLLRKKLVLIETHSIEHILQGVANIFMGLLKAVPGIGLIIFMSRHKKARAIEQNGLTPYVELHYSPHKNRNSSGVDRYRQS